MNTPQADEKRALTDEEKIADIVVYHKPDEKGLASIDEIRAATKNMLLTIVRNCPRGDDRKAAIRSARLTMMLANACIVVPQYEI